MVGILIPSCRGWECITHNRPSLHPKGMKLPAGPKLGAPDVVTVKVAGMVYAPPSGGKPTKSIVYSPSAASSGTVKKTVKSPLSSTVVAASSLPSSYTLTSCPADHLLPVAVTSMPGGPSVGSSVMVGWASGAVTVKMAGMVYAPPSGGAPTNSIVYS